MSLDTETITAIAHPNIALVKYWGDQDPQLHVPANGSISMGLDELVTRTSVRFDNDLDGDTLTLNGETVIGERLKRVTSLLDVVRQMAGITTKAQVTSENNFPMGAGIASSASAFAALSLSASHAAGLDLDEAGLSRLARRGSGSACRSIPAGFAEWLAGQDDLSSYALSIAAPDHWTLADCIAIVSLDQKSVSSGEGHSLAHTSPLQHDRLVDAPRRLSLCRDAILERDFSALSRVVELDSNMMHSVMITSSPPILYWQPATVGILHAVTAWRTEGLAVCYTVDAGPNVHVLCPDEQAVDVSNRLQNLPGVQEVIIAHPGGPAGLVDATKSG